MVDTELTEVTVDPAPQAAVPEQVEMTDGWRRELADTQKFIVKQRLNPADLSGKNTNNRFDIANGSKKKIAVAMETNASLANAISDTCSSYSSKIMMQSSFDSTLLDDEGVTSLTIKRKASCPILCWGRPVATVTDVSKEDESKVIGKVRLAFACLGSKVELVIPDAAKSDLRVVAKPQLGLCCPSSFGPCSKVYYNISRSSDNEVLGTLVKTIPDLSALTNSYDVDVSKIPDVEERALLLSACLMVNRIYFNTKKDETDSKNKGR